MNGVPEVELGVRANGGYRKWLLFFAVVFIACIATLAYAVQTGSADVPWAFLTANFVFLIGVSQFGVAFTAIMRVIGAKWARPYYRLGEIVTLAYMPIAIGGLLIIYFFGRHDLFYWLDPVPGEHHSAWLNESFLLTRNLVAQIVFLSPGGRVFHLWPAPRYKPGKCGERSAVAACLVPPPAQNEGGQGRSETQAHRLLLFTADHTGLRCRQHVHRLGLRHDADAALPQHRLFLVFHYRQYVRGNCGPATAQRFVAPAGCGGRLFFDAACQKPGYYADRLLPAVAVFLLGAVFCQLVWQSAAGIRAVVETNARILRALFLGHAELHYRDPDRQLDFCVGQKVLAGNGHRYVDHAPGHLDQPLFDGNFIAIR